MHVAGRQRDRVPTPALLQSAWGTMQFVEDEEIDTVQIKRTN